MAQPLLEGTIDLTQDFVKDVAAENERLQQENRQLRNQLIKAKAESEAAIAAITALRAQLSPLHRAMRAVFGEITIAIGEEVGGSTSGPTAVTENAAMDNPRRKAWEKWIQKLGGHRGNFIQCLLEHGPSNARQLMVAMGINRMQTVYDTAHALSKIGLVRKNGEMYGLVE